MNATLRHVACLLAVLAAGTFLVSCGNQAVSKDSPYEQPVKVIVKNGTIQDISLTSVQASQPGVIKWMFDPSSETGYIFPDSSSSAPGIAFKIASVASAPSGSQCTGTPDPGTVIHNCGSKLNGAEYHCNVKKGNAGNCFAYTATVVPAPGSSASAVPSLDPWVKQQ